MLLEDVIRFNLPHIFSYFGYDYFSAHVCKVTKDAEIDIDNDITTSFVQKIQSGLKNRRKGKAVRFVYDKEMNAIKAGVLAARLVEAIMKDRESTPKAKYKPGGVCSGEKVETEPKEEAEAKQAAEKADEKVPSFLESLIKEMELRNFEPVMAGKITIHSETKKEI